MIDRKLPVLETRSLGENEVEGHGWNRISSKQLQASVNMPVGNTLIGAIRVGNIGIPLGPVYSGADAEWFRDDRARRGLEALSRTTGGKSVDRLDRVWETQERSRQAALAGPLIIAALFVLLYDAFLTRVGSIRAMLNRSN